MFDDILDIHFKRWAEGKKIIELALLNDDIFLDFFETRKNLFNKKHYEFMLKLKDGFSGYFEFLGSISENKIKLRNILNGETYEVISDLKPIKFDIIISRIYEDSGELKLLEELSFIVPYFLKNRLDFNQQPYQNYLNFINQINFTKNWDGFDYKEYIFFFTVENNDIIRFINFIKKTNFITKTDIGFVINLKGKILKFLKRLPIYPNEIINDAEFGIITLIPVSDKRDIPVITFFSIGMAKAFFEYAKNNLKIVGCAIKQDENLKEINFEEEFNSQYKIDLLEFYNSKKTYSEEEFKFYYNLEAHFKEIGALNFLEILEKNE
ncbi:MAG: hypothetical protein ABIL76_03430 [candidate division WOR-3 bacterium]